MKQLNGAATSNVESLTNSCADTAGQEGGNCNANFGRAPGGTRGLPTSKPNVRFGHVSGSGM